MIYSLGDFNFPMNNNFNAFLNQNKKIKRKIRFTSTLTLSYFCDYVVVVGFFFHISYNIVSLFVLCDVSRIFIEILRIKKTHQKQSNLLAIKLVY